MGWAQAALVILVNLLVVAYYAGGINRGQKEHERRLDASDEAEKNQWSAIGDLREDMGKVKGKLGMNGA